ncbi:MAG: 2-oxoacid:acceptor oxidoreductase family protein [Lachnospiraceae bacterium]|nr:2-oxoacid:acceptor oxidoreductase family protein [Lachnospiraceae bacterium]
MGKTHKICCAGFGGQGVMSMGQLLTYAGMLEGKEVSWCPSYGPEMRGGTANCAVVISEEPVGSPVINSNASVVVAMNGPSYDKFIDVVAPGGSIYINSSIVTKKVERKDIKAYYIPANNIALDELKNLKLANIVMLGAVNKIENIVDNESILEAFKKVFGAAKEKFIPVNREALKKGAEYVEAQK